MRRNGLYSLIFIVLIAAAGLTTTVASGNEPLLGLDLQGGVSVVLQPTEDTNDEAIGQAIEIIRQRVDGIGVAEPEIARQGDAIVVQLPGVKDRERALELVGQTAELRFRPVLQIIPPELADLDPGDLEIDESTTTTVATDETDETTSTTTTTTTTEDLTGLEGFSLTDPADDVAENPVTLSEYDDDGNEVLRYMLGPTEATGRILSGAEARLGSVADWTVGVTIKGGSIDEFNDIAFRCFNRDASCPTGQLAIVLDSQVQSAPSINEPSFAADAISISGTFTEGEAKDLALVLRYGSLPVELEPQQTQSISASLGQDALDAGVIAGLIGLALVALYMVVYYRLLGVVAILSLSVSAALLWTLIAYLGENQGLALTLAGVTGIIVSIGVAVDSNVVFYEHLKEDVWRGRTLRTAVDGSFASAFSTIVKADVASLIGAGILYMLTVGPVRGFALYLGLSTVLDLVASYFFMRPLALILVKSERLQGKPRWFGMPVPRSEEGSPA